MEDRRLRAEFHRAYDAVLPPAPWLSTSVREGFRARRHVERTRPAVPTAWLVPAVAVLLAIAMVAVVLYAARSYSQRTVPVKHPRTGQATSGCPSWTSSSNGGLGQGTGKMTSALTGWSTGVLRTTDGGAHWRDVAPPAMRYDAPSDAGARPYPPSYTEFFLDSNHAWVARTYSSATSCFDHVSVFVTSDGGWTWDESAPISAAVQLDTYMQLQLAFIDPQHGWMLVLGGGRIAPDWFVYSTADGGRHWKLVSQLPIMSSTCGMTFISQTTGFLGGCRNSSGRTATLTVTRDGGKTWNNMQLPEQSGNSFSVLSTAFFESRGFAWVGGQTFEGNTSTSGSYLVATSDTGKSWQMLPGLPAGYPVTFHFLDPNNFWILTTEAKVAAQALYKSSDGGNTWTLLTRDLPVLMYSPQVIFIDQRTGFILQSTFQLPQGGLELLVTTDGGRTWKDVHPQIS